MQDFEAIREENKRAEFGKNADILCNSKFIFIEARSGHALCVSDPEGVQVYFELTSSNEVLGAALLDVLDKSRFLSLSEETMLLRSLNDRYEAWVADVMTRYGYKNRSAMFKGMKYCSVNMVDNSIKITPTCKRRGEDWDGMDDKYDVIIHNDQSPEAIGAAIRLALDRSIA